MDKITDLQARIDKNRSEPSKNIDGAELLSRVQNFLKRFVAYPNQHAPVAHSLWVVHTHLMACWESTPRIAFLSPEPGSGKTRALEVTELLVPRPVASVNATPAYLFRKVSDPDGSPTILFDEIDTLFGAKAREHEEVRGLLNAGHRRGATAGRCVVKGKIIETEELPAYCAVALAGLGNLPDTILSRSIIVRMRRRAPTEAVEPFRRRLFAAEGHGIRDEISRWAVAIADSIFDVVPSFPDSVTDRNADIWESLLTIADAAGGLWPDLARVAAVAHVADAMAGTPSLGVRLLEDIRRVFSNFLLYNSSDLIAALIALEESPWGDLRGSALDSRKLANLLKPYGVRAKVIRQGNKTPRGYSREDFHDSWSRYLAPKAIRTNCETPDTIAPTPALSGVVSELQGEVF